MSVVKEGSATTTTSEEFAVESKFEEDKSNSQIKGVKEQKDSANNILLSPKVIMEDIYPDADSKPEIEDDNGLTNDDGQELAPVYLLDVFITLPPSVWQGSTSLSLPSNSSTVSTVSKSNKKKSKKHLAVTRKSAYANGDGNRVIQLPQNISNKDTFLIIRQTLSELQETSHITCYHLEVTVGSDILESESDGKGDGNMVVICQDFMEIGSVLPPHNKKCSLTLVPELYDIKRIRHHVKKIRDTILFPPLAKAVSISEGNSNSNTENSATSAGPPQSEVASEEKGEKETLTPNRSKAKEAKNKIKVPNVDTIFHPIDIADFFSEVLFRTGKPDLTSSSPLISSPTLASTPAASASTSSLDPNVLDAFPKPAPALFSCVKSITLSGWNPPPPYRKVQGDLMYLEVITGAEGVFHITAISSGFYVNRNNRHHFDPTPSSPLHFHHSLWDVLLEVSGTFRAAWAQLCRRVANSTKSKQAATATSEAAEAEQSNPLDTIATYYSQGRGDLLMLKPQWLAYTPPASGPSFPAVNSEPYVSLQTYDLYRAQEDLCDIYGVDELGATRDWNDEIQTVRFMPTKDIQEKIISARYEFKVLVEFTDACKAAAVAISSGLINPITDLDPQPVAIAPSTSISSPSVPSAACSPANQSHIFSYNGIFYSKAMDNKDSFRLCVGDEAYRKLASRDLQNQNILRALNVPGLCTVPFTLIDYKGDRIIGQGMIPGILAPQGDNFASLMYGVLERGKNLTVKNSSLLLMQTALKQLHIPTRTVLKNPFVDDSESVLATTAAAATAAESIAAEQPTVAETSGRDSPSRLAVLQPAEEMATSIRIDTQDEVVLTEVKGGINVDPSTVVTHVGPIELKVLKGSDGRLYCLEVMRLTPRDANYVKGDKGTGRIPKEWIDGTDDNLGIAYVLRRELVILFIDHQVHTQRQDLILQFNDLLVAKAAKAAAAKASESKADEGKKEEGEEKKKDEEKKKEEDEEDEKLEAEYLARIKAITADSIALDVNPNVFLQFDSDVDPSVILKDEETARKMAIFLWDVVMPHLTNQVREGGAAPKDSESMIKLLHNMGINLRYLGQLAKLARQQENLDEAIFKQKLMKVNSMPHFWLELLLTELLARAVKHHLNSLYRSHPTVSAAPALTIVSLLNHLFVTIFTSEGQSDSLGDTTTAANDLTEQLLYPNAASNREGCLEGIQSIIASRFCVKIVLVAKGSNQLEAKNESDSNAANISFTADFLGKRLSPIVLLRRICQLCGIQIALRHYNFQSPPSSTSATSSAVNEKKSGGPFSVKDIISLVPVVKSCQQEDLLPEVNNLIASSAAVLQQPGGVQLAFELMQQASQFANQIAGPLHKQSAEVSEQLANLLTAAGDLKAAVHVTVNNLSTAIQLYGLDSSHACTHHIQLAVLYSQLKDLPAAVNHLLAARYIIEATGGPNHPLVPDLFVRFGKVFEDLEDYDRSVSFYSMAKRLSHGMASVAQIGEQMSSVLFKRGQTDQAIEEQKRAYTLLKDLIPDSTDIRVLSARSQLEKLYRNTIEDKKLALQKQAQELKEKSEKEKDKPLPSPIPAFASQDEGDVDASEKKKASKKKNKTKK